MYLQPIVAQDGTERQPDSFCISDQHGVALERNLLRRGGGGRMGVATAPEPRAYAAVARSPRAGSAFATANPRPSTGTNIQPTVWQGACDGDAQEPPIGKIRVPGRPGMRDPGSGLPRTPLPRTPVNRGRMVPCVPACSPLSWRGRR